MASSKDSPRLVFTSAGEGIVWIGRSLDRTEKAVSGLMRAAIAAVLLLALSQSGAVAAAAQSSSSSVTVMVLVSRSLELSLPAPTVDGSASLPAARSNAPLQLSADTGPSAVTAASSGAAEPAILYTVVSR